MTYYIRNNTDINLAVKLLRQADEDIVSDKVYTTKCDCGETIGAKLMDKEGKVIYRIIQCSNCYQEHPYVTNIILPQEEQ